MTGSGAPDASTDAQRNNPAWSEPVEAVVQNSCLVSVSVGPQASALIAIATRQVVFITALVL